MSQRAAIYARVSTVRQGMEQTIESQVEALREYVHDRGWILEERHIYLDDGYSGTRLARPGLAHLWDGAHGDALGRDMQTAMGVSGPNNGFDRSAHWFADLSADCDRPYPSADPLADRDRPGTALW